MMPTEIEIDVAASAMMDADHLVRYRHSLNFGDCRVLSRLALEAVERVRAQEERQTQRQKTHGEIIQEMKSGQQGSG